MATAQPNSSAIPLSGGYYVPTSAPQSPPQNSSAPQPAAAKTPPPANPNSAFQTNVTTPIQSPVPATSLSPTTSLNLPQPAAPTVQSSYFSGVANDVQTTKDALQAAYDKRSADISSQLDTLKQQQQDALKAEQGLSQPFQEQLEKTQEQALHVNTNFEANQSLANELNSLVTEANQRLTSAASGFTSKSYGQAVYSSTLQDITARAGLIQSAMSAYNGQISAAYTQIDRAVAAINADRTDQLNYYQTLLSLNQQGQLDLTDQAKTLAQNQISTLQKQADDAQSTANAIKQAMIDPDTAQAFAQAGVTLTDTPEEINQKLATYAYSKELSDQSNQMAANGFTTLLPGQTPPSGAQTVTLTDSQGKQKQYYTTKADTQIINLGNGQAKLVNTQTGQTIATYGTGSGSGAGVYNGEFASTIGIVSNTGSSVHQQEAIKEQMQQAIASGDYQSAYQMVLNATANGLDGTNRTTFNASTIDLGVLTDLQSAIQDYTDAGGDMNILKGKADTIGTKIGQLETDPQYATLAVRLDRAFQQYRLNMTGAAFGDKESAEYASVLPSKNNSLDLNLAKIDGALQSTQSYINSAVKAKIGSGGVEIGQRAFPQEAPPQNSASSQLDTILNQSPTDIPNVEDQPQNWFDKFMGVFGL